MKALTSSSFRVTRECLVIGFITFAIATISPQCIAWLQENSLMILTFPQALS
jgi:hypothetical protein